MQIFLERTKTELKLRNYSPQTLKCYLGCLKEYFSYLGGNYGLNEEKIKEFLLSKQKKGNAPQTVNLHLNAIKFFYRDVLKDSRTISLKFGKKSRKLPVVLSRQEISGILAEIKNHKHRLMISLAYGSGLRVSETVGLKVRDVLLDEGMIHLKQAKGGKDWLTVMPKRLKKDLKNSADNRTGDEYLFASERGGKLSARTAQIIFARALGKTGIKKSATFHSLRHSFATHLFGKRDGCPLCAGAFRPPEYPDDPALHASDGFKPEEHPEPSLNLHPDLKHFVPGQDIYFFLFFRSGHSLSLGKFSRGVLDLQVSVAVIHHHPLVLGIQDIDVGRFNFRHDLDRRGDSRF